MIFERPHHPWALASAAPAVLLALGVAAWDLSCASCERSIDIALDDRPQEPENPGRSLMPSGQNAAPTPTPTIAPATPVSPGPRSVQELERALYLEGSVRGTEADGNWGIDAQGQLRPSLSLRHRFDHYLGALGEASAEELTALMQSHAARELNPEQAAQVRAVWDHSLLLKRHAFVREVDLRDPASWERALAERHQVRAEILGADWAEAFYREEEDALRRHIAGEMAATGAERR